MTNEELLEAIKKSLAEERVTTLKLVETAARRVGHADPLGLTPAPISAEERVRREGALKSLAHRDEQIVAHMHGMENRLSTYVQQCVEYLDQKLDQRIREASTTVVAMPPPAESSTSAQTALKTREDILTSMASTKAEVDRTRRASLVAAVLPTVLFTVAAILNRLPATAPNAPAPTTVVSVAVPTPAPAPAATVLAPPRVEIQVTPTADGGVPR